MPAKRLPWIKYWIDSRKVAKVAMLTDAQFRTWIYVLAEASEQRPVRWRFNDARHASLCTARPLPQVTALVKARLLDALDDGLWVHDWEDWQKSYPSDFENPERSPERSANAPLNAPRTLRERSPERSANAPDWIARAREDEDKDKDRDLLVDIGGIRSTGPYAREARPTRKLAVPEDFEVTREMFEWASVLRPAALNEQEVQVESNHWHDHHEAKGTTAKDWNASWRTWMRNASKLKAGQSPFGSSARTHGVARNVATRTGTSATAGSSR